MEYSGVGGETDSWKKNRSKKSRDTVPLNNKFSFLRLLQKHYCPLVAKDTLSFKLVQQPHWPRVYSSKIYYPISKLVKKLRCLLVLQKISQN